MIMRWVLGIYLLVQSLTASAGIGLCPGTPPVGIIPCDTSCSGPAISAVGTVFTQGALDHTLATADVGTAIAGCVQPNSDYFSAISEGELQTHQLIRNGFDKITKLFSMNTQLLSQELTLIYDSYAFAFDSEFKAFFRANEQVSKALEAPPPSIPLLEHGLRLTDERNRFEYVIRSENWANSLLNKESRAMLKSNLHEWQAFKSLGQIDTLGAYDALRGRVAGLNNSQLSLVYGEQTHKVMKLQALLGRHINRIDNTQSNYHSVVSAIAPYTTDKYVETVLAGNEVDNERLLQLNTAVNNAIIQDYLQVRLFSKVREQ